MVGGIVVDVREYDGRLTLEVRETTGPGRCLVDVPGGYLIEFGDAVWWQGGYVYWTPAGGSGIDRRVPKLGYSRPAPTLR